MFTLRGSLWVPIFYSCCSVFPCKASSSALNCGPFSPQLTSLETKALGTLETFVRDWTEPVASLVAQSTALFVMNSHFAVSVPVLLFLLPCLLLPSGSLCHLPLCCLPTHWVISVIVFFLSLERRCLPMVV